MVKRERFYKSGRPIEFKTCARTKEQAPIISKIRTMIITNFFPFIIFTSEGLYQIFNSILNKLRPYFYRRVLLYKHPCAWSSSSGWSKNGIQNGFIVIDPMILPSGICNRGRLTVHFNGVVGEQTYSYGCCWLDAAHFSI